MNRLTSKQNNSIRRKNRVRTVVRGTTDRPRLSVTVSNKYVSAQIIDDSKHATLVSASSLGQKSKATLTEQASAVGQDIAKKAKAKKIKKVSFDRGSKLYHGRVKALADAAREQGLEF